ncbi:PAAR domain-containing protein [Pseudomonas sp. FW306-02-F02-AA]|nr:PAAR domain-containing protein [Pseudomonas sp. FW306-02-F02-AB]PMZ08121.1 PAAR domain-containing protein [Pseudomonas sp. FW306-02-H06C]PMZ14659.1 PAAR domain-containing protein [Pseudomonas sp. FW306-02-F02-AA]PMZ20756.1 PAAR domain-containing protein [Pseudomonas sp. FW306-02-F08-AA]PMZ25447.1 PAAR domain-containing protein [Pseudomonas sp. FW306-02-F04-BA]PMZ32587.1 PAAR domain-containing protein [Pseudomonas sp. FW306-02-H06B]PMZ39341.1 PAAR domain-containing protein [Pseudomonas sp. 
MCKGVFPIAEGSSTYTVGGIAVALDGMKTACGASLIASDPKGAVISWQPSTSRRGIRLL